MINTLKIDLFLFRKQIKLSGLRNIILFVGIHIVVLFGFKYLTSFAPNTFPLMELFALSIAFLGGFKIHSTRISKKQVKMITFFPYLTVDRIKKYYLYKKPFFVYFLIMYLLFPTSFTEREFTAFFFFLSIIMIMMFINTLSYRLFSEGLSQKIYIGLRITYFIVFASYLFVNDSNFNLESFVLGLDLWYLILIGTVLSFANLTILPLPNGRESIDD